MKACAVGHTEKLCGSYKLHLATDFNLSDRICIAVCLCARAAQRETCSEMHMCLLGQGGFNML